MCAVSLGASTVVGARPTRFVRREYRVSFRVCSALNMLVAAPARRDKHGALEAKLIRRNSALAGVRERGGARVESQLHREVTARCRARHAPASCATAASGTCEATERSLAAADRRPMLAGDK